ncbi:MAG: hypothetical protein KatS3mg102_0373 [Planctomycetota bacterium]|nr:MAG: hypothetical protein KatS3mg102_0373 [Planctomycetota bacterium]
MLGQGLLEKTGEQQPRARAYLVPFARSHGHRNERRDDFVRIVPVRPGDIDTLAPVAAVDEREVLEANVPSRERVLDREAPSW